MAARSARAAYRSRAPARRRGGGLPCPSQPPFSLSLFLQLVPEPGSVRSLCPHPHSPTFSGPLSAPRASRTAGTGVAATSARRTSLVHPPGDAGPNARLPLAGAGHGERGVSPHRGRRSCGAGRGGGRRAISWKDPRREEGRVGKRGKSEAGRKAAEGGD